MAIQEKRLDLSNAVPANSPPLTCRIDEMPERYGRLLAEYCELVKALELNPYMSFGKLLLLSFSPRFQFRFWRSHYIRDFFKVPDAIRQDLPCAANLLQSIQALDDAQLRALARCSGLNVSKLTNRFFFGPSNKAFVTVAAVLAAAKGLKEIFEFDLAVYVSFLTPVKPLIEAGFLGLAIGTVFNLLRWYQPLRQVRALDDIISIAAAARNLKQ